MKRILIVGGDPQTKDLLTEALAKNGYRISAALGCQETLSQFGSIEPDLIIIDVPLPSADGWEAVRQIRGASQIPLIALGDERVEVESLDRGADHFVPKPFHPKEICARVRALLRRAESKPMYTTGPTSRTFWPANAYTVD